MRKARRTSWIAIAWAGMAFAAPWQAAAAARAEGDGPVPRLIAEINELRARHALPALDVSATLSRSSERFAAWQMTTDRFAHAERIRAGGHWAALGEAIAIHRGWRARVGATVRRWSRSPSHAALLLSPAFEAAGAGVSRGRYGRGLATIWVLHLARR
jgi:uncharacterized protein YkwD